MTKLLQALSGEPITLDEAKRQCYIPTEDNDADMEALLSFYITVAREVAENWTWRGLLHGEYVQTLDCFPCGVLEVDKAPLLDVVKIEYYNSAGVLTEFDGFRVDLNSMPGRIEPVNGWPVVQNRIGAVQITFEGGYEFDGPSGQEVSTVPESLKAAMLMLVKQYYDNRDASFIPERSSLEAVELPFAVRMILDSYSLRTLA